MFPGALQLRGMSLSASQVWNPGWLLTARSVREKPDRALRGVISATSLAGPGNEVIAEAGVIGREMRGVEGAMENGKWKSNGVQVAARRMERVDAVIQLDGMVRVVTPR